MNEKGILAAAMPPQKAYSDEHLKMVDLLRSSVDTKSNSSIYSGLAQGMGLSGAVAASAPERSRTKSFTVKPIKNGYLLQANYEEIFCVDLEAVGMQVVAIMAAHMMEA